MYKRQAEEVIRDLVNLIECQYIVKGNIVSISALQLSGKTRRISGSIVTLCTVRQLISKEMNAIFVVITGVLIRFFM